MVSSVRSISADCRRRADDADELGQKVLAGRIRGKATIARQFSEQRVGYGRWPSSKPRVASTSWRHHVERSRRGEPDVSGCREAPRWSATGEPDPEVGVVRMLGHRGKHRGRIDQQRLRQSNRMFHDLGRTIRHRGEQIRFGQGVQPMERPERENPCGRSAPGGQELGAAVSRPCDPGVPKIKRWAVSRHQLFGFSRIATRSTVSAALSRGAAVEAKARGSDPIDPPWSRPASEGRGGRAHPGECGSLR